MQDSMLGSVLANYLESVKEREFDLPLATLIGALGFFDIHYTHGIAEFGKDFIAKKEKGGIIFQYTFQSKAGDITQTCFRNDIMGQMLESVVLNLSHPCFDKDLPHQSVLVITGKLAGNSGLSLQNLNERISNEFGKLPIIVWDKEFLIPNLVNAGLGSVYQTNANSYKKYGMFYQVYGKALDGVVSVRELQDLSLQWLDISIPTNKRMLCSAIEASVFIQICESKGLLYHEFISQLTFLRTIMHAIYLSNTPVEIAELKELYDLGVNKIREMAYHFFREIQEIWGKSSEKLYSAVVGTNNFLDYSISCSRIIEIIGCLYFVEEDKNKKTETADFLESFVRTEPGCSHPISDYYGVSIVLPTLALIRSGRIGTASLQLERTAVWLCDRYQEGYGLADLSSEQYEEINYLFGYAFEFCNVSPRKSSFLATIISDLAAINPNNKLYLDILNDIKAVNIAYQYFQVPDTASLFTIQGEDIVTYPNIEYREQHLRFENFNFAEHIDVETSHFSLADMTDKMGPFFLMLLLRDRYFPTLWVSLI